MKNLVAVFLGLILASFVGITVASAQHEVQKGDTLWEIAVSNNTTVDSLMEVNNLKGTTIYPKQILQIKGDQEVKQEKQRSNQGGYYIVKKGDTLGKIGSANGITVTQLKTMNNLSSHMIYEGQKLALNGNVPAVESKSTSNVKVSSSKKEEETKIDSSSNDSKPQGKTISVEATAYTAYCSGCSGITATGVNLKANPSAKVIAVDPNVIPLGTKVHVEGYGYATASDTGGAIQGNKIDIHVPTKEQAYNWGRRNVKVTIVN
ncbi:LysM peptidoglycan-binding and 3D domain-containing protein [Oceanobacillus sp. Castelsardo]|uniref:LysM peptidoglycan-binding and 3D domain-containing protein n=1 Tax=Oceanobacillus sp. Castelsardo TaxID=1851204 RepID=UPI00083962E1|nr:3D domain-containing protein [Oceanobacillus sp. Castelsardo]